MLDPTATRPSTFWRDLLLLALALTLVAPPASNLAAEPTVSAALDPRLVPLLEEKSDQIPARLRKRSAGLQGRQKIHGQDALSLILRTTATRKELESSGIVVRSLVGEIATVDVLPSALGRLAQKPGVQAIALPTVTEPLLDKAAEASGVDDLRNQISGGGFTGHTGRGVIVGIVDSGIDYDHPNFEDENGNTRILYLWDQTSNDSSRSPSGYNYGAEWAASDIDAGLPPQRDPEGHGTHVAGIAAGNGAAADENGGFTYVGVAPEASIVFVKTTFATVDVIDGLNYIFETADRLGLPAVVNLSLGNQAGAHEGMQPMEQVIDSLVGAQNGRAVVVSSGNDANKRIYSGGAVATNWLGVTSIFSPTTPGTSSRSDQLFLSGYYDSGSDFTLHLQQRNDSTRPWRTPVTRTLGTSTTFPTCTRSSRNYGFIELCNSPRSARDGTDRREFLLTIDDRNGKEPKGEWRIIIDGTGGSAAGSWDAWIVQSAPRGNWTFKTSRADKTLGSPATSRHAITVGAYSTKACWTTTNGDLADYGDIEPGGAEYLGWTAKFSSQGPTADGRLKPDLTAPGAVVASVKAREFNLSPLFQELDVNDDYVLFPGTSMAAPMVAGAVALLFEENPTYSHLDIKAILTSTARQDAFTTPSAVGPFLSSTRRNLGPNAYRVGQGNIYGWGKLDLNPWFGDDPWESNDNYLQARPVVSGAPVTGQISSGDLDFFRLPDLESGDSLQVEFFCATGQRIELTLHAPTLFSLCDGYQTQQVAAAANRSDTHAETLISSSATSTSAIKIEGFSSNPKAYDLSAVITRPETSSSNYNTSLAQRLPSFKSMKVTGNIHSDGDVDYFRFSLHPGETVVIQRQQGSGTFQLRDATNTVVSQSTSTLTHTAPAFSNIQQAFFLRVDGFNYSTGDYRFELETD